MSVIYKGTRTGFATGIVSVAGALLAFVFALGLSSPIADSVYKSWVSPGVTEKIDYESESDASRAFSTLRNTDMSQATVKGMPIEEFKATLSHDETGKVSLDLSVIDLSNTGISEGDLWYFGIDAAELTEMSLSKLDISGAMYNSYSIEDIILSRAVSVQISKNAGLNHEKLTDILDDTIPGFSKATAGSIGGIDIVSVLIIEIINSDCSSLGEVIDNSLVKPVLIIPIKTLIFVIVFALICIGVSFAANALRIVNKIPVIGAFNSLLGGILGAAQALIVVFMVCIGIRILVSLTSDNIIFLNSMTIDETLIFRHIYNIGFLNF
jgi:uncharacterized membrane protein required for colicin V production